MSKIIRLDDYRPQKRGHVVNPWGMFFVAACTLSISIWCVGIAAVWIKHR